MRGTDLSGPFILSASPVLEVSERVVVEVRDRRDHERLLLSSLKGYDAYTYQHCVNVGILSLLLAEKEGLGEQKIKWAALAGMMHDIGKVRIPETILNKPGGLTMREWEAIKAHPVHSAEVKVESTHMWSYQLPPDGVNPNVVRVPVSVRTADMPNCSRSSKAECVGFFLLKSPRRMRSSSDGLRSWTYSHTATRRLHSAVLASADSPHVMCTVIRVKSNSPARNVAKKGSREKSPGVGSGYTPAEHST